MDRGLYNLVVHTFLLHPKKAFDTVNHGILLHKLQLCGFEIRALNFMRDYLTNRTQIKVSVEGLIFRSERGDMWYTSGKYTWSSPIYNLYQRSAKLSQNRNT